MGRYKGSIGDDGLVRNGVGDSSPNIPALRWTSTRSLECNDAPPATPTPPPPPPPPGKQTAVANLGVAVRGPTTLRAGESGTYTVTLGNSGDVGAPVEFYASYSGQLKQTGAVTPSGGFNCDVINNAGGTTAVHCTTPQLPPKGQASIVVQGRGAAPGPGHLTATISTSDATAQFIQRSQGLDVSIT